MTIFDCDATELLKNRRRLRRELSVAPGLQPIRIAVLGGSTTSEVVQLLELALFSTGFAPTFYESAYGRFYEEATIEVNRIKDFKPDFVYLHTHYRDVRHKPNPTDSEDQVAQLRNAELNRFREVWSKIHEAVGCQLIQNNFETAPIRSLGNFDSVSHVGFNRFLSELNLAFAQAAACEPKLVINDVHALASCLGLERWFDWSRWYSYKILTTPEGSALIAGSLAAIIGASRGKAKKCLVLDLDNTLWGGVIGDDGLDRIQIGKETAVAEAYTAFQQYCLDLRRRGVILAVCSKNDELVAKSGFTHPDSILKLEHFSAFRANWNPKDQNIREIAAELNLGLDSFVFVDDNPAERAIVAAQIPEVAVPNVGSDVSLYPGLIEYRRYFETISFSEEDIARAAQYAANTQRTTVMSRFGNYGEYLDSLEMNAEISTLNARYLERATQLINKSNQFNLTTRRYAYGEVEHTSNSPLHIALYGRLADAFGDNGLVSVIIGHLDDGRLHIDLWIMSCRVLKRDMEHAMLDSLVSHARDRGLREIIGVYKPSGKNELVRNHYDALGFDLLESDDTSGSTTWSLSLFDYSARNSHISVTDPRRESADRSLLENLAELSCTH